MNVNVQRKLGTCTFKRLIFFFLLFLSLCARWVYVCGRICVFVGVILTEAEELYQKRVLTITGICVALLVVGIVCVVAYCKTK